MLIRLSDFHDFHKGRIKYLGQSAKIANGETIFDDCIVYGIVESEVLDQVHCLPPVLRGIKFDHPIAEAFRRDANIREERDYQYVYVKTEVIATLLKDDSEYARKRGGAAFLSSSERWVRNYISQQEAFIEKYKKWLNVEIQETHMAIKAVRITKQYFGHRMIRELISLGVKFEGRNNIPDIYSSIEEWQKFNNFYGMYENAKHIIDPERFPPIIAAMDTDLITLEPYTHVYLKRKSKPAPIIREKAPVVLPNLMTRKFVRKSNAR